MILNNKNVCIKFKIILRISKEKIIRITNMKRWIYLRLISITLPILFKIKKMIFLQNKLTILIVSSLVNFKLYFSLICKKIN